MRNDGNFITETDKRKLANAKAVCRHSWSKWKETGRTGDWFKPVIVERYCAKCGKTETDDR